MTLDKQQFPAQARRIAAYLALGACLALVGCQEHPEPAAPARDVAAESFNLPAPAFSRLEALPGAPPLHPAAQARVDVLRSFFARDFDRLNQVLESAHREYVEGRSERDEARRLIGPILKTKLAGVDVCADWLKAQPNSYPAHWVCGAIWQEGAWQARTHEAASKVSREQFAIMNERLMRSNQLEQMALTLSDRPIQALGVLANNLHLQGRHDEAEGMQVRARTMLPADATAYTIAANFAMPRWGGSIEEVKAIIEQARKAGVHADSVTYMLDHNLGEPWSTATPGAERAYWERAVAEHASADRLESLFRHLLGLSIWRDALAVSDRVVTVRPQDAETRYWRGHVNEALGRIPDALAEYRLAAALGNDTAIEHLIRAHLHGTLGLPAKDIPGLLEVCRYGASLGSGAAANCLGSGHWDGSLPPLPRDADQALAWHLFASRAGHFNSQHDFGWLVFSNRQPAGMSAEQAKRVGVFWLRRSAEQGHTFAPKKLEQAGVPVVEREDPVAVSWFWVVELVGILVDSVLRR